jgi:ureidoacrylate peracid hydrolase
MAGTWGAEFFALSPTSEDVVVEKQRYSGFVGTSLKNVLRRYGRDVLVITGFATNVCVESTARHATDLDYRVVVASDATGTPDGPIAHAASLDTVSRHIGRVVSSDMVIAWWGAMRGAGSLRPARVHR